MLPIVIVARICRPVARAAMAVAGAGLALLLLEVLVRATGSAPAAPSEYGDNIRDAAIGYRRRPGSSVRGRSESGEFAFHYVHNALGFRDTEHVLEKAGRHRPHCRAGRQLHLRRRRLSIAARPTAERAAGRAPTRDDDQSPCAAMRWSTPAVWIYLHSALGRIALRAWGSRSGGGTIAATEAPSVGADGPWEDAWRTMEGDRDRMHQLARAHGARLVLVALPQRPPWGDADFYSETRLARWSAARDVDFIPTLAALQAVPPSPPLYWPIDGHCTPRGYGVIADAIAAGLRARGLAP